MMLKEKGLIFSGKKKYDLDLCPDCYFLNLYQSFFLLSYPGDNLFFKLAMMKKRSVHICEQLQDTNTLYTS